MGFGRERGKKERDEKFCSYTVLQFCSSVERWNSGTVKSFHLSTFSLFHLFTIHHSPFTLH
jgi:hypothetical protein